MLRVHEVRVSLAIRLKKVWGGQDWPQVQLRRAVMMKCFGLDVIQFALRSLELTKNMRRHVSKAFKPPSDPLSWSTHSVQYWLHLEWTLVECFTPSKLSPPFYTLLGVMVSIHRIKAFNSNQLDLWSL